MTICFILNWFWLKHDNYALMIEWNGLGGNWMDLRRLEVVFWRGKGPILFFYKCGWRGGWAPPKIELKQNSDQNSKASRQAVNCFMANREANRRSLVCLRFWDFILQLCSTTSPWLTVNHVLGFGREPDWQNTDWVSTQCLWRTHG